MTTIHETMILMGKAARESSRVLALTSTDIKNSALREMAASIRHHQAMILKANAKDMSQARENKLSDALLDRLALNAERIEAMAKGFEAIALLPDPVGKILSNIQRPNGLEIKRISIPLGVVGVIYESRPNVTADAAGLCLKSGNAVILRGGSESFFSSTSIIQAIHEGLEKAGLPTTCIQMVTSPDRTFVSEMLKLDHYIDVLIPRGGQQLIDRISAESRIPLFKHLAGLCHTYIHQAADKGMARKIILNAKMRRTGICGTTETLLIDQAVVNSHLPAILNDLINAGCEVRGDEKIIKLDARVKPADETDYKTEYLDAIISVKTVTDINAAIRHIAEYGTQHTEAIITEDHDAAKKFLSEVDSAIVMHNASTQFADGGEFGMGAEIGIATGKLHARGPVGVEQLTTFKYLVLGKGQVRP